MRAYPRPKSESVVFAKLDASEPFPVGIFQIKLYTNKPLFDVESAETLSKIMKNHL